MLMLRERGKTHVEIAQITGRTRSYVSTILKRLAGTPEMLEGMSRGGVRSATFEHCRRRKSVGLSS